MSNLRNKMIRLAHKHPELREQILPLLKEAQLKTVYHEMLLNLLPRYQAKSVGGRPSEETVTWKNVGKWDTVHVTLENYKDLYIQYGHADPSEDSPSDWFVQHKRIYIAESSPKNVSRVLKQILGL